MTWLDTVARMAASAGVALVLVSTAAGADLLANGNMEQTVSNPNSLAGWSDWLWEGEAQISHTTAPALEGARATLLQGFGPTKIAIFQKVALVPCSYRLTAAIAGMQLTAGTFDLSIAVFISYEAGRPVLHQLLRGDNDSGGSEIDSPNLYYHVWMMIEDPGYLEYYLDYLRRTLLVEGQPTHETQTAPEFLRKYYMHAGDQDWSGEDIWDRYIPTRFHPREFDVMVSNGQLNLRFDSHGDAFALPLSALIIYPKIEEKRGKPLIDELWHRLKIQFDYEYRQILPPLPGYAKPPGNAVDGKLRVFERSIWEDAHATGWPASTDLVESLKLNVSKGAYKAMPLSLHAHEQLQLIGLELSLPGFEIWSTKVRYMLTRISEDGSVYWNGPRLLDPQEVSDQPPLELPKHRYIHNKLLIPSKSTTAYPLRWKGVLLTECVKEPQSTFWRSPESWSSYIHMIEE